MVLHITGRKYQPSHYQASIHYLEAIPVVLHSRKSSLQQKNLYKSVQSKQISFRAGKRQAPHHTYEMIAISVTNIYIF